MRKLLALIVVVVAAAAMSVGNAPAAVQEAGSCGDAQAAFGGYSADAFRYARFTQAKGKGVVASPRSWQDGGGGCGEPRYFWIVYCGPNDCWYCQYLCDGENVIQLQCFS